MQKNATGVLRVQLAPQPGDDHGRELRHARPAWAGLDRTGRESRLLERVQGQAGLEERAEQQRERPVEVEVIDGLPVDRDALAGRRRQVVADEDPLPRNFLTGRVLGFADEAGPEPVEARVRDREDETPAGRQEPGSAEASGVICDMSIRAMLQTTASNAPSPSASSASVSVASHSR